MPSLVHATNSIDISYSIGMQPLIDIEIGGQWLKLVYDASSGNTAVFVKETKACTPSPEKDFNCYSYDAALKDGTVKVCKENENYECDFGPGSPYKCEGYVEDNLTKVHARVDILVIDGVEYDQRGVEATENVSLKLGGQETALGTLPVRLLVNPMVTPTESTSSLSLPLFGQTDGIFGASGPTLSCRSNTVWNELLKRHGWTSGLLIFDFYAPVQAAQHKLDGGRPSRIVFNDINATFQGRIKWSQPKQSGDILNDGMHEFLVYHPRICGIDLLYNSSSNWLAVIDTSGPCLTLPAFLFDRLRSRVPLECPFAQGDASAGRLCQRAKGSSKLPNFVFQMEDMQQPRPAQLVLPLERLMFNNGTQDLLCLARDDSLSSKYTADMTSSHIAIGSLAVAAFYTVVDLSNKTVGLAPRGDISEGSDDSCTQSVSCSSPMQTYYPPLNLCEDPPCSEYMFMRLDQESKMCVWSTLIPVCFGLLLVALVALDFVSHKLYKQAIAKASEYRP